MLKQKVAVLVSGGGTNLQALIDAQQNGLLKSGQLCLVIASNPEAYALHRAKENGIPFVVADKKKAVSNAAFEHEILKALAAHQIDILVLAGFMCILSPDFVRRFPERILNVHPSLIPSFCGDGFYGLRVHQAALDYGVKLTGATVHFVNEITDGGKILKQKAVAVLSGDTPELLQKRVMEEAEWVILPEALEEVCIGYAEKNNP